MGAFFGGKNASSTVSTSFDPNTQAFGTKLWDYGLDQLNNQKFFSGPRTAGVDPLSAGTAGGYSAAAGALPGAITALQNGLAFDPRSIAGFMNPYQGGVIDALNPTFDRQRAQAHNDVADAATHAGAFGGSRAAITEGVRLGEIDRNQSQQVAGLLDQGYNTATSNAFNAFGMGNANAASLAGLGMGGLGGLMNLGQMNQATAQRGMDTQYADFNANRGYGLDVLSQIAAALPRGTTQMTTEQAGRSPGTSALGGAVSGATIGSKFGPWGTAIGGGIGGLLGLFG